MDSPSQFSIPSSIFHHPYFTPAEVDFLSEKQRGKVASVHDERLRQQACGFLEAIGTRAGLSVSSCFVLHFSLLTASAPALGEQLRQLRTSTIASTSSSPENLSTMVIMSVPTSLGDVSSYTPYTGCLLGLSLRIHENA